MESGRIFTGIQGLYGGWAVGINSFILIVLGANTGIQEKVKIECGGHIQ
jgi:hypothetical protein